MKTFPLFDEIDASATRVSEEIEPSKRRVQGGETTSDVVLSAAIASNAQVFAEILGLHVPLGASIADITYGKGVFWQDVARAV